MRQGRHKVSPAMDGSKSRASPQQAQSAPAWVGRSLQQEWQTGRRVKRASGRPQTRQSAGNKNGGKAVEDAGPGTSEHANHRAPGRYVRKRNFGSARPPMNRVLVHWAARQGKTLTEDTPRFGRAAETALCGCSIRGKPMRGNIGERRQQPAGTLERGLETVLSLLTVCVLWPLSPCKVGSKNWRVRRGSRPLALPLCLHPDPPKTRLNATGSKAGLIPAAPAKWSI